MVLDRRGFMKFAAGASAGIMVTPLPWKLLDDISIWTQNWPWIPSNMPGENTFVSTTSKMCPSACGMKVRLVNGRPVRTLSNPEHPLGGGISALAAAEVELLYSPARLKKPMRKMPDGAMVQISWQEAEKLLLEESKKAGASVACISGDENGSSVQVLSAFLSKLGSADFYLMPSEAQAAAKAWALMGGKGQLGYDLENSDFILAIGANVLESWGTVVRNRKVFDKSHPNGGKATMQLMYAGPVQNNTAAVADKWIPIKPGTEAVLALGLAGLVAGKSSQSFAGSDEFKKLAAIYTPAKVAEITGLPEKVLAEVADALVKAKKPVVVAGSEAGQGGGAAPVMAGIALNMLLRGINVPGGLQDIPLPDSFAGLPGALTRQAAYGKDLNKYLSAKPVPKMLMVYEANPVYAMPASTAVKDFFKSVPFKVAFTTFLDESATLCDLVLPMPLGLERMDDIESPYGCGKATYALGVPVTMPVVEAKPGQEVVLALAKALGLGLVDNYKAVLESKASYYQTNMKDLTLGKVAQRDNVLATAPKYNAALLTKALEYKPAAKGSLAVAPVVKLSMGTAKTGIPPFNTKLLRATDLVGADMCVLLSGATAQKLGVRAGSRIKLLAAAKEGAPKAELVARITIYEGIVPDTVGIYLGFGHTALDAFSQNKGGNVMQLLTADLEPETDLMVWSLSSVDLAKA